VNKMERTKCEECGGKIEKKKMPFHFLGEFIGDFDTEVCNSCGEKVYDEKTSDEIDKILKKKGLYGLNATTKVGKVGDSLDIRINRKIVDYLKIKKGDKVTIYPEDKNKLMVVMDR